MEIFVTVFFIFLALYAIYEKNNNNSRKFEEIEGELKSNFDKQKEEHKKKSENVKPANSNGMFKQNISMDKHLAEYLSEQKDKRNQKYQEYLKTDKWYDLCTLIYKRDNYRCRQCYKDLSKRNGNVHHLSYNNIFKETLEDLVLLCPECHNMVHYYYDKRFPLSLKKPLTQVQYLEAQEMMLNNK